MSQMSLRSKIGVTVALPLITLAIIFGVLPNGRQAHGAAAPSMTFTVTNLDDSGPGSLRDAIDQANMTPGADTIDFQDELFGTITLTSGELHIIDDLTINGPGIFSITVSGNHATRVFRIAQDKTVSISGLTVSDAGGGSGTGVCNLGTLTLTNMVLSGNYGGNGGGIENLGSLAVTNSTLSGNSASNGGGIFNFNGTLVITNSTLSGNHASNVGGGIDNSFSTVTISNSTLSGNSSTNSGGGIVNQGPGTANISFTTLSGNSASASGGIFNGNNTVNGNTTVNIKNSIVANSTSGGDCSNFGSWNATGVNFTTNGTCPGFTQVTPAQLNLGPLANNGGPTKTHALLAGSVAIDAVTHCTDLSVPTPAPVTTDQRGVMRPRDGDGNGTALCDVGAFEVQPCTITCPPNQTANTGPGATDCCTPVNYPDPTVASSCGSVACSPPSGSCYPVGTTTVTCGTVQDGPSCTFTVTVSDNTPPVITCPMNQTLSANANCQAVATYSATATDNCTASPAVMCTPPSGSTFNLGTTTVTCTATDGAGNTAMCTFTVTVNDTQPPSITCPTNITKPNDPNQCGAVVTYPNPTVSDNCPNPTFNCSPASGSFFPVGMTTVTCTAKDAANNMASCTFTVTVQDTQLPVITCPPNFNIPAAATCPPTSTSKVTFTVTATDNCPGVAVVCNPPSGSAFPVGTTTVTCTATDSSGNTANCSFTVTIFSACLVDQTNPGNVVLFNAVTGQYRYCCSGMLIASGTGVLTIRGCIGTLDDQKGDRKVHIEFDFSANNGNGAGTAFIALGGITKCSITDQSMAGNTCTCDSGGGPPAGGSKKSSR